MTTLAEGREVLVALMRDELRKSDKRLILEVYEREQAARRLAIYTHELAARLHTSAAVLKVRRRELADLGVVEPDLPWRLTAVGRTLAESLPQPRG